MENERFLINSLNELYKKGIGIALPVILKDEKEPTNILMVAPFTIHRIEQNKKGYLVHIRVRVINDRTDIKRYQTLSMQGESLLNLWTIDKWNDFGVILRNKINDDELISDMKSYKEITDEFTALTRIQQYEKACIKRYEKNSVLERIKSKVEPFIKEEFGAVPTEISWSQIARNFC